MIHGGKDYEKNHLIINNTYDVTHSGCRMLSETAG